VNTTVEESVYILCDTHLNLSPENGGSCEVRRRCASVASFLFGFQSLAEVELVKRSSPNWRASTCCRLGAGCTSVASFLVN
jgi:hypothetical protein